MDIVVCFASFLCYIELRIYDIEKKQEEIIDLLMEQKLLKIKNDILNLDQGLNFSSLDLLSIKETEHLQKMMPNFELIFWQENNKQFIQPHPIFM